MSDLWIIAYPVKGASHFLMKTVSGWELSPDRGDAKKFATVAEACAVRDEIVPGGVVAHATRVSREVSGTLGVADGGRKT